MKTGYRFLIIAIIGLVLGAMAASTAYALPPGQDPRPTDSSGGGGNGSGGGDDDNNGGGSRTPQRTGETCATLTGQVINWGVGPMSGVGISLETGSWQLNAESGSDGNFGFGGMGVGMARLKVTLAPELGGSLSPLIQDAGVYLNCNAPTIANIAVHSGDTIQPPVTLELSAPAGITPGESTVIRARIRNGLPNDITNVILTNLMPPGLTPTKIDLASDTASNIQILDGGDDGQMAYVYLPSISSGMDENILITITAARDLRNNIQLKNTATLFYRESVAVQDSVELRVGGAPPPAVAPTATDTPETTPTAPITETETAEVTAPVEAAESPTATVQVAAVVAITATVEAAATPTVTVEVADMGDEFVPPGQMPTTGDDLADEFVAPPLQMPATGDDFADEFVAPPLHMPATGNDLADEFVAPPSLLPETGVNPALPQTLPNTGIGFLLPLLGMGFGGLAFALHQLRRRF
ncbi:MAG: hypothetical protein Kow0031_12710 [Anaerolineae bacterium]